VGSYDPMVAKDHPNRIVLDTDRIKHWLGVGAQPTERVARFFGKLGLGPMPTIPKQTQQHLPKAKAQERMKAAEQSAAAAGAAPAAEAGAETPAQ